MTFRPAGREAKVTDASSTLHRWIVGRFDAYGRAWLVGGLLLMAGAFLRSSLWPFSAVKATALCLTAVASLGAWVAWSAERRRWLPPIRLGWAALAFTGASVVATAWSFSPAASLIGQGGRHTGLVPRLACVGVMFAVVGLYWERPERLRTLLGAVAGGAVVVAVATVLQHAGVDRALWAGPVDGGVHDYPYGTIGNSEFAGGVLGISLPALWYLLAVTEHPRWRTALAMAVPLVVAALWFSQSRGGMLAAIVGSGVMALVHRGRIDLRAKVAVAAGTAVVVALVLMVSWHPGRDAPVERIGGIEALRTETLQLRFGYWRAAVRTFAGHPVAGTGLNTFYAAYPPLRPESDAATYSATTTVDKPHNIFLEHAADGGILTLGSYLVLVSLALAFGWRRTRRIEGRARMLLGCFMGMLAGYLAQGAFSIDEPALAILGWVAIAGICVLAEPVVIARRDRLVEADVETTQKSRPPVSLQEPSVRSVRWIVHGLVAFGMALLASAALRPLRGDVALHSGNAAEALRQVPINADYHYRAAVIAQQAANSAAAPERKERFFALAQGELRRANQLRPGHVGLMAEMARLETRWAESVDPGRFPAAESWWRRTMATDPRNAVLTAEYRREVPAARQRSVSALEAHTNIRPDDVDGWINLAQARSATHDTAGVRSALEKALALDLTNPEALKLLRMASSP